MPRDPAELDQEADEAEQAGSDKAATLHDAADQQRDATQAAEDAESESDD